MTEKEYKQLLIDTIQAEDHENKDKIIELLKISTISFVSALSKGGFSIHTNSVIMIARC